MPNTVTEYDVSEPGHLVYRMHIELLSSLSRT